MGYEEGVSLGQELGSIISRVYRSLSDDGQRDPSSPLFRKAIKLLQEVLDYPLDNREDPEKEAGLLRIRGQYKEFCAYLGDSSRSGSPVSSTTPRKAKNLDF